MNLKLIMEKTGFVLRQASPEILLGSGIVLSIAAIITACSKMKQTEAVQEELQEGLEYIEETEVPGTKEYLSAKFKVSGKAILRYLAIFWLPILLWLLSMGSFWYSHGIMVKRNADLASFAVITMQELDKYRERVRDKIGAEAENDLFYNLSKRPSGETITITDENGKEKKVKLQEKVLNESPDGPFDRIFDRTNPLYTNNPSTNIFYINSILNNFRDLIKNRATKTSDGWVTINEVYEALNFDPVEAGFDFGWTYSRANDAPCTPDIDFGICDCSDMIVKDHIAGKEMVIPLHFNCKPIDFKSLKLKKK